MAPLLLPSSPIHSFPATPKLSFRSKPRPIIRAAAGLEVDSFTKKSGYLFQLSAFEAESLLDYSPSRIAAIYRRKPLILLRRLIQISATFGKWFGVRYIDNLMERSDQMFKVRAAELRKILVELGPAYIKIAQAVSSRPTLCLKIRSHIPVALRVGFDVDGSDLIPPSYLDELSLLQDRITPFSTEVALDTIEKELGLRIDELFSEISPEPVAAASLGQVYQARLRRSGQVVAVKVQRPGVQAAISLDILILRFLAGVVKKAGKFNTDLQANHIVCRRWTIGKRLIMDSSLGDMKKLEENDKRLGIWQFENCMIIAGLLNSMGPSIDSVRFMKEEENDRVYLFLAGLNRDFDEVRARILGKKLLPSIREAFSEIRREEFKRKVM
ncbi:hypothetical protein CXB51_014212 [Gossypium anomalum]|uniref:ABC1 atypical kinase-like domain-containing protein n=1 Tax=Gossypium anomalum TaxID=47600 RepID=A0A8J5YXA6_9ROSI|nr:hypothetical protein CXB51_014212 [Gossypium anomalum]